MPVFLFTDMEGSTRLWEQYPAQMGAVLARHDAIIDAQIQKHGGRLIKHLGDGAFAVFENDAALACALDIQRQLSRESWGFLKELRVRLVLHAGEAEPHGMDYVGPVINRTYRLLGVAWGGQILVTPEALAHCRLPPNATLQDLGLHLLRDLSEPQRIWQLHHPDLPAREYPPLRSLSAYHLHNLPQQLTLFIGREQELQAVQAHLRDPACRLLTLIGPGGIGKTRLALQAAAELVDAFADGVYYIPLAALSSPDLIASMIADTLKFFFYSREDPFVQLRNYLREKEILLILDNFEHLVQSAGRLAELLEQAPGLKLLVTSRERLNLRGEWLLPLGGLTFPSDEKPCAPTACSAIQLFVQSARRVKPDFTLTDDQLPAVIQLCRLLEGLPLGIELAAAWVRLLSCQELLEELEHSLDFLSATTRDLPQRQRSLQAVFEYSYSLLSPAEQQGLCRLAVFRGPFTREAALAVAEIRLPLLVSLVDKSLLHSTPHGHYRLHEVVRQYALAKLQSTPAEYQTIQQRHWRWYAELLIKRTPDLKGGWQLEAMQELRRDLENIRAGWNWALQHARDTLLIQTVEGLALFYELQGLLQEGWETFGTAIQVSCPESETSPEALQLCQRLVMYQARFAERLSRYTEGQVLLMKSLALAQQLGDPLAEAITRFFMGTIAQNLGDYQQARQQYQASLVVLQAQGENWEAARILNGLGNLMATQGEFQLAQQYYQQSLELSRALDDRLGAARAWLNLGTIAAATNQNALARQQFQESLQLSQSLNHKFLLAVALDNLGSLTYREGHYSTSRPIFEQVLAIYREIGHRWGIAFVLNELALIDEQEQQYEQAEQLLEEALSICQQIGQRWGLAFTLHNKGTLALHIGQLWAAADQLKAALKYAAGIQAWPLVTNILVTIAELLIRQHRTALALELIAFLLQHQELESSARAWLETQQAEAVATLAPEVATESLARGQRQTMAELLATLEQLLF